MIHRGTYPENWNEISLAVREAAGWRCVRCRHPFDHETGKPLRCWEDCDGIRCRYARIKERGGVMNYGVHHLDNDKANCRWWNLLALDNACHLNIQSRVQLDRPWLLEHSKWFLPYVSGFYAFYHAGQEITREQAEAEPDRWLALGQPWRFTKPVHIGEIVPGVLADIIERIEKGGAA